MVKSRSLLALAGWSVFVASATDVVYVTDLSIFSVLVSNFHTKTDIFFYYSGNTFHVLLPYDTWMLGH